MTFAFCSIHGMSVSVSVHSPVSTLIIQADLKGVSKGQLIADLNSDLGVALTFHSVTLHPSQRSWGRIDAELVLVGIEWETTHTVLDVTVLCDGLENLAITRSALAGPGEGKRAQFTLHPMEYAHSFVVLCHVVFMLWIPYFIKEVNPSLAKPPSNFDGGLAKLWLTSLVK